MYHLSERGCHYFLVYSKHCISNTCFFTHMIVELESKKLHNNRTSVLYCIALCCTVLYCTVLYCTVLYCTVLYCTVLYCTVLYCTVLYCTVLYCTVLYCCVYIRSNREHVIIIAFQRKFKFDFNFLSLYM